MAISENVIAFRRKHDVTTEETIDDICAKAFLFLRDSATAQGVPLKTLLAEHMLGMMLMVRAVEGEAEAQRLLTLVSEKIAVH